MLVADTAIPMTCFDEDRTIAFSPNQNTALEELGYTSGLIRQLEHASAEIALRIWILDNSASMNQLDRYAIDTGGSLKNVHSMGTRKHTRWDEVVNTVLDHSHLAVITHSPVIFRLVNPPPDLPAQYPIMTSTAAQEETHQQSLIHLKDSLHCVKPIGTTLLTSAIHDLCPTIIAMKKSLKSSKQHIVLVIATDGIPSDENGRVGEEQTELFVYALNRLKGLPLLLIIRLSTDDMTVRHFYNEVALRVTSFRIVIIHDFISEARQVQQVNPWITYSIPVQRVREFGHLSSCIDFVSRRVLTKFEMRDYLIYLLGYNVMTGITDPDTYWKQLIKRLKGAMEIIEECWDPIRNQSRPLIDIPQLTVEYAPKISLKTRILWLVGA